jgi:hypothetical protein
MPSIPRTLLRAAILAVAAAAVLAADHAPAEAQYFGRNRVQYRTFDFQVLRTTHFDVYYYPEAEAAAQDVARMAERWYARLSRVLDHEFEQRQPLILYANHPHFQQTTATTQDVGDATQGFTDVFKQRVVMPMLASYEETDHLVGHELVHAFQFDISGLGRAGGGLEEAARRFNVPLWFIEGMAEYLSVGPIDAHTAMWLRDGALNGRVPTLEQITYDPRFFPYRWGHAFWAYVGGRWGDRTDRADPEAGGAGRARMQDAFQRILNAPLDAVFDDWGASIRQTYLPLLADRLEAREMATPLVTQREQGGRLNVAPAVSPDGRRVVFLSELSRLDIELWMADAETGELIRRLVRGTAFDPHFGSLRFVGSGHLGARLAPLRLRRPPPRARRAGGAGHRPRRHPARVHRPGRRRDLQPHLVARRQHHRLLGRERRLHQPLRPGRGGGHGAPAHQRPLRLRPRGVLAGRAHPGGEHRPLSTDLERLSYGNLRLALMDVQSGELTELPAMAGGKNINPAWTRDGRGLFFISDRGGIANVYRLELATGEVTQVTNLFTGVSGITGNSPAISSASQADRLVFAAYERGGYNLYALSTPEALAGMPLTEVQLAADGTPLPALLPPVPRPPEAPFNRVLAMLDDDLTGLPDLDDQERWTVGGYRPRLTLDYLGQPSVGASASTGPFSQGGLYGGVSGIFSDVLGYHSVYATVQAQGQLDEIGFSTAVREPRRTGTTGAWPRSACRTWPARAGRCTTRKRTWCWTSSSAIACSTPACAPSHSTRSRACSAWT